MDVYERTLLSDLHDVIPVLQTHKNSDHTVSLISLERWDGVLVGNFVIEFPTMSRPDRGTTTQLNLAMTLDGYPVNDQRGGGGFGGGGRNDRMHNRSEHRFRLDRDARTVDIAADLLIGEYARPKQTEQGWHGYSISEQDCDWRSVGTYAFTAQLPTELQRQSIAEAPEKPAIVRQFPRTNLSDDWIPQRVIPICQTQQRDDWLVTLIALEVDPGGMHLTSRIRGGVFGDFPELALTIRDDAGNGYAVWSSAGGGDHHPDGKPQWRWWTPISPALDPQARWLFIDIRPAPTRTPSCKVSTAEIEDPLMTFVVAVG